MIRDEVRSLILEEQVRQKGKFVDGGGVDDYLEKIFSKAEVVIYIKGGDLCGMTAFYCNDYESRVSYITLLLVSVKFRGEGIASFLIESVLERSKRKNFKACRLEVRKENDRAIDLYINKGFELEMEKSDSFLMRNDFFPG